MKTKNQELDVDFIQSRPLTKKEEKELSEFIRKSKLSFKKNKNFFSGPMVVLINEGVRSGKEALAYQFKKTKRAFLIGDKTPGYFSTGQYFYADEALNYILYLCVFRVELDGHKIEGVGIEPDETILYKSSDPIGDTQLSAGLKFLSRK